MTPSDIQHEQLERWVGIDEVAEYLAMSTSAARRLLRLFDVPRRKWGHRTIRYRLSELDEVLVQMTLDDS